MGKFEINILGCGSALPTLRHYPSTQILNIRDNLFMIDCGEGAQMQFRRMRLKFMRLGHIFLSHLHGDHCFGLIGMISTFSLMGRTGELVVHAHPQAESVFRPQLDFFCRDLPFTVRFEPVLPGRSEVIYEDRSIKVTSLPMIHRVPCSGFLFEEKPAMRHLLGDMVKFYDIPVYRRAEIKAGADYVGLDEYIDKIKGGWTDVDVIICTPSVMAKVGAIGRILGPRGLMPNPKTGTVTMDVASAVREVKAGKIDFKVDKTGIVHAAIGKVSFTAEQIFQNALEFLNVIVKLKPQALKGTYIKSISLCSTMSPGVKVDVKTFSAAE